MQDVEKRFSEKNEDLSNIVNELKSELAEKSEEIGRAPSELQSHHDLVCRLLLEKKKKNNKSQIQTTKHK